MSTRSPVHRRSAVAGCGPLACLVSTAVRHCCDSPTTVMCHRWKGWTVAGRVCDIVVNKVTKQIWGPGKSRRTTSVEVHRRPGCTRHLTRHSGVPQEAYSTFRKSPSVAYIFTKGVNISDNIGIGLSSQTGYDHEASLAYVVGSSGRLICGLKGPPGVSAPAPRVIVAGTK